VESDHLRSAVSSIALAFADDVFESEIGCVVGLNIDDVLERAFERVLGRRIHHLEFDPGVLGAESDEDDFLATNSFARREPDVINAVTTFFLFFDGEQIVGKLFIFGSKCVAVFTRWILELCVDLDGLQISTQLVDDGVVGSPLFHQIELVETVLIHTHA